MLFKKLMILYAFVLLFLTTVFVGMNLSVTRQVVLNEVYGTFNAQMNDGTEELSRTFESARNLVLELCVTESIQDTLRSGYEGTIESAEALRQAEAYAMDKGRLFPSNDVEIILLKEDGTQYILDETSGAVRAFCPKDEGYRSEELQGDFVWDYLYTDYGAYVRVSHVIYDETDWDRVIGIASVRIYRDYLLYTLNSMWLGQAGRIYMTDEHGQLLFPYVDSVEFPDGLNEQVPVTVQGETGQSIYFQRDIPINGYHMIGVASDVETLERMAQQRKLIFLIAAVILGTATLVTLAITYRISTPILKLARTMEKVGEGKFDGEIPVPKGKGEISILYNNFSQMLKMQNKLTEEIYGAQVREKEAELRALQAQINPHFLYNTLDSINWMAVKYGADDIEEVVTDLSQMLRYSLNNGMNILRISDELIQIRSYIKIQQLRFSDSFKVSYDVDEDILDHRIIKLLLQPLVENAVLHGFDESGQRGELMIQVKHEADGIRFCVKNNGHKMDLKRMEQALQQPEGERPAGYGLRNVNDRLIRYYGAASCLHFAVEGEYSFAWFTIPYEEGLDEEKTTCIAGG